MKSMLSSHTLTNSTASNREEDDLASAEPVPISNSAVAAEAARARAQRGQARGVLRRGAQGDAVSELQQLLNAAEIGVSLEVDGKFGAATQSAVSAYQDSRGLKVDGAVGSQTWGALDARAPAVQAPAASQEQTAAPAAAPAPVDNQTAAPSGGDALDGVRALIASGVSAVQAALSTLAQSLPSGSAQSAAAAPATQTDVEPVAKPTQQTKPAEVIEKTPTEPAAPSDAALSDADKAAVEAIITPVRAAYREYKPVATKSYKLVKKKGDEYKELGPKLAELEHALTRQIAAARAKIAQLPSAAARAFAFKRINDFTAFQYQIANADILSRDKNAAGGRTCNVTSVTMVLQGLGKQPSDYQAADWSRVSKIAAHFQGKLEDRGAGVDPMSMAMPDFMQIVAIDRCLSDEPTGENISKARNAAASKITGGMDFLVEILAAFGASAEAKYHKLDSTLSAFGKVSKGAGVRSKHGGSRDSAATKDVAAWWVEFGDVCNAALPEFAPLEQAAASGSADKERAEQAVATINEKLATLPKSGVSEELASGVKKKLANVPAKLAKGDGKAAGKDVGAAKKKLTGHEGVRKHDAFVAAGSLESMQKRVSIDAYQAGFLERVNATLASGGQVVVNLADHYVRLQSIQEDGFIIDDPGTYKGDAIKVTWAEGIADGYFRKYIIAR